MDLFFERVTEDDVAEQPRSYSSALRSGINKNVLDAQTKRVAKGAPKKSTTSAPAGRGAPATRNRKSTASARSAGTDATVPDDVLPQAGQPTPAPSVPAPVEGAGAISSPPAGAGQTAEELKGSSGLPESQDSSESDTSNPAKGAPDTDASASTVDVSRETRDSSPSTPADSAPAQDGLVAVPGATFADLSLDSIHPNRRQPRVEFNEDELAELVHSIREIGVLQPVVVRPSKEEGDAPYELVMGERRLRASREAGMDTIPAIIRSTLDDDLLRDALLENLHRSALNPLEEAAAYQQLLDDFGCSHDELAGRLGRSRPQISNTLRLMKLPPLVQRRVAAGILSAGHARALLGLADPAEMEKLAQRIVAEGLSVRSTEEVVALSGGLRRASKPSAPKDGARHERLDYLATSLSDRLDTNVKITLGAKKGRVSIEFASVDDLNRIIGVLSPSKDS
ncbi:ParB/RepB/Spo0J family partition protein [Arthrobacter sp. Ld5]|uniref:ParB/RepB/Spo0J family partition protein n=1 Tax=Arthrobacter sp. Ld5 TaxID=649152 RepID=UPI003EBB16EA